MADHEVRDELVDELDVDHDSTFPHSEPMGGTGSLETAGEKNPVKRILKLLGPGLITGASDDDPSGIGTYTTAGELRRNTHAKPIPLTMPTLAQMYCTASMSGKVSGAVQSVASPREVCR